MGPEEHGKAGEVSEHGDTTHITSGTGTDQLLCHVCCPKIIKDDGTFQKSIIHHGESAMGFTHFGTVNKLHKRPTGSIHLAR